MDKTNTNKFRKKIPMKIKRKTGSSLPRPTEVAQNEIDPFPGPAPLKDGAFKKYYRSSRITPRQVKDPVLRKRIKQQSSKYQRAVDRAARSDLLLTEDPGYLEPDSEDESYAIKQHKIASAVDITSAAKFFNLDLHQFGPYHMDFSRNGRYLLLGGSKGHVAAMDWVTKKLLCEINVTESVHDVTWLHMPTMFAVAQKNWVHVYDNQGVELHCLKQMHRIQKMEFLPYHFLLATASDTGYLSWLDVSVGKMINQFHAKSGCLDVLCQNPTNAILATGHSNGTVKMWSPNTNGPLINMLCHPKPVRAVSIDKKGIYMATASIDRSLKIWDLRNYKVLRSYKLGGNAGSLAFSQTGLLALTMGNNVEIYRNIQQEDVTKPYLRHVLKSTAKDIQFCPYEDVLGLGHAWGYSSMLIPGSAEANFDALESNPFMTTSQRREMEVKALLEKIQPEMISLNPRELGQIDVETMGVNAAVIAAKKPRAKKLNEKSGASEPFQMERPKNMSGRNFHFLKQTERKKQERLLNKQKEMKVKINKKLGSGALGRFMKNE